MADKQKGNALKYAFGGLFQCAGVQTAGFVWQFQHRGLYQRSINAEIDFAYQLLGNTITEIKVAM